MKKRRYCPSSSLLTVMVMMSHGFDRNNNIRENRTLTEDRLKTGSQERNQFVVMSGYTPFLIQGYKSNTHGMLYQYLNDDESRFSQVWRSRLLKTQMRYKCFDDNVSDYGVHNTIRHLLALWYIYFPNTATSSWESVLP